MKPILSGLAEMNASLWLLAASPALWSAHFMASYVVAAMWCGRIGDGAIAPVRAAVVMLGFVALAGILTIGIIGYGWHRAASGPPPHDADTPEDRRGFMGAAMLLLSGLSGVGVIYTALAALLIGTCR